MSPRFGFPPYIACAKLYMPYDSLMSTCLNMLEKALDTYFYFGVFGAVTPFVFSICCGPHMLPSSDSPIRLTRSSPCDAVWYGNAKKRSGPGDNR